MFECPEKNIETNRRHTRIGLTALLLFVIGIPAIGYYHDRLESPNPQLDHTVSISDEPAGQTAENVCERLPVPEKFDSTGRREPQNDYEQHLVVYDYSSPRRPEEILPSFLLWFSQNGWRNVPGTETAFRKGDFGVYIRHETTPTVTNYSIYCSKKK